MEEKIKRWEEEIERLVMKQKEYNQKCNEQIRSLRLKIQETNQLIRQKTDQQIAETVRDIYGDITPETLELFKKQMMTLREKEPQLAKQQHISGESQSGNRL